MEPKPLIPYRDLIPSLCEKYPNNNPTDKQCNSNRADEGANSPYMESED